MQERIALSVRDNRRTAVPSCHGAGKSKVGAGLCLWFGIAFPGCKIATTAPSFRQVKNIIWANMRQMHERALMPLGGELFTTRWEMDPEWYAFGFTTKDPDAVSGIHAPEIFILLDEAAGILNPIWKAIEGLTSSAFPRVLSIGNPTDPTGGFKKECDDLAATNPEALIRISAFDTPNLQAGKIVIPGLTTQEWVEERKRDWGEESPLYVAKVLGEFPDQADDALIRMSWAEKAKVAEFDDSGERVLAVDVARFGRNRTVAYLREGRRYRRHLRKMGLDTVQVANLVWELIEDLEPDRVVIDDSGVGGGVTDQIRDKIRSAGRGPEIDAFNGQNQANDPDKYSNRRTEGYWTLRGDFREGLVDIEDGDESDDVISQLTSIRYRTRNLGRQEVLQIETKDEMERRGMPSPDDADAIMMSRAPAQQSKVVRLAWGS
ncbi:hypothetical protein SAMN05660686_02463 [Thalassobaculum litoreum DSM 18839]|uniref:Terminase n=2 Tax=Thalassobaculum TaxID=526215 RepID=A0A8G2EYW8_9PROT|nr:hypothetical protein SAMN05660686_02463 [Thalassobaculum litoreum DSM 18839]